MTEWTRMGSHFWENPQGNRIAACQVRPGEWRYSLFKLYMKGRNRKWKLLGVYDDPGAARMAAPK